ncbi:M48 family metallopeptidase [Thermophagus sp. OGC60D27]|uniref:M48 family metallopeptidase n=1 Tax=Thermophagus sp. OGC60D27 TaxID=3458415 RepID=UPI0040377B85
MPEDRSFIHINGVGPVLFKSNRRCKRLSIRLKPFEDITVLFPPGYPRQKALAFVEEKKDWIIRNREKIQEREKEKTVFDENTSFRTRHFQLKIEKGVHPGVKMTLRHGILRILYPPNIHVADELVQNAIREGIEEAMRIEAKIELPAKVRFFASQFHFSYNRIFVKNLKSRWGSCSSINNINLNLQLMRLPEHLIDYVILHELCHTVEKNHGPRFWHLLNQVTGGKAKILAAEMKQYRTTIY